MFMLSGNALYEIDLLMAEMLGYHTPEEDGSGQCPRMIRWELNGGKHLMLEELVVYQEMHQVTLMKSWSPSRDKFDSIKVLDFLSKNAQDVSLSLCDQRWKLSIRIEKDKQDLFHDQLTIVVCLGGLHFLQQQGGAS